MQYDIKVQLKSHKATSLLCRGYVIFENIFRPSDLTGNYNHVLRT